MVKRVQSLTPAKDFRLFITSEINPKLPTGLVRISDKIISEAQTGVKATLSRFFMNISSERLTHPEKNRLYLMVGWTHAIIQERLRFVPTGWTERYGFTESDALHALDSIDALLNERSGGKLPIAPEDIPWESLRMTLSKSIFGGRISNPIDQKNLDYFLDKLFVPSSFDVDFKLVEGDATDLPILPEDSSKDGCIKWISDLPTYNPPTWIGLDSTAEERKSKETGKKIIEKISFILKSEVNE